MARSKEKKAAYNKEYRAAHKPEIAAYLVAHRQETLARWRAYHLTHKTEIAARHKAYRAAHREAYLDRDRAYRATHPEAKRASARAYHAAHREELRAYQRAYYAAHTEDACAWARAYRRTEKGRQVGREGSRKRRALKRQTAQIAPDSVLTQQQWAEIIRLSKGKCYWCGKKVGEITQDHVIPLSKGGLHVAENVVASCLSCNCSKGAKIVTLF